MSQQELFNKAMSTIIFLAALGLFTLRVPHLHLQFSFMFSWGCITGMSSFTNSPLRKRAQSFSLTLLGVTDPALYSFKAGNKPTSSCRCFTFQLLSRRKSGNNASTYLKLFYKPVSFQSLVRILARQILHCASMPDKVIIIVLLKRKHIWVIKISEIGKICTVIHFELLKENIYNGKRIKKMLMSW